MTKQKRIKIPWWLVPEKILLDIIEATGGLIDPTKAKWTVVIDQKGERHYGVAG